MIKLLKVSPLQFSEDWRASGIFAAAVRGAIEISLALH
jgi:hypothetical protein